MTLIFAPLPPSCSVHRPDAHKQLLNNLFSFDWNAGDNIIVAYMHLLGLLVSANPSLLSPIAKLIVRNLLAEGVSSAPSSLSVLTRPCISQAPRRPPATADCMAP